jgi:hypothetical protein
MTRARTTSVLQPQISLNPHPRSSQENLGSFNPFIKRSDCLTRAGDLINIPTQRPERGAQGANLFVAKYSMKAQNSTDMLCAWRGKDLQGTSLPKVHPKDLKTGFRQCGLGFAMSYRLAKLLKKC